ncbi:hypothetical protein L1987_03948 [Smallanthus sonchifolius]|uniref:Uncharacterized protein n=1 Tax=Smallanthus sonchifolius TaxID=185202 RepID=A0ACB9KCB4_9ASTR|nr:hypothetical protein L1987_03948 [Smallanthus sonchifolius]
MKFIFVAEGGARAHRITVLGGIRDDSGVKFVCQRSTRRKSTEAKSQLWEKSTAVKDLKEFFENGRNVHASHGAKLSNCFTWGTLVIAGVNDSPNVGVSVSCKLQKLMDCTWSGDLAIVNSDAGAQVTGRRAVASNTYEEDENY